ncbi:hypothetical protein HDU67_002335 [Dinochytrium kinnereticum]|nr:hypothetical protein HDU67_002335 [Dinochytrium kinnereticum]
MSSHQSRRTAVTSPRQLMKGILTLMALTTCCAAPILPTTTVATSSSEHTAFATPEDLGYWNAGPCGMTAEYLASLEGLSWKVGEVKQMGNYYYMRLNEYEATSTSGSIVAENDIGVTQEEIQAMADGTYRDEYELRRRHGL